MGELGEYIYCGMKKLNKPEVKTRSMKSNVLLSRLLGFRLSGRVRGSAGRSGSGSGTGLSSALFGNSLLLGFKRELGILASREIKLLMVNIVRIKLKDNLLSSSLYVLVYML